MCCYNFMQSLKDRHRPATSLDQNKQQIWKLKKKETSKIKHRPNQFQKDRQKKTPSSRWVRTSVHAQSKCFSSQQHRSEQVRKRYIKENNIASSRKRKVRCKRTTPPTQKDKLKESDRALHTGRCKEKPWNLNIKQLQRNGIARSSFKKISKRKRHRPDGCAFPYMLKNKHSSRKRERPEQVRDDK